MCLCRKMSRWPTNRNILCLTTLEPGHRLSQQAFPRRAIHKQWMLPEGDHDLFIPAISPLQWQCSLGAETASATTRNQHHRSANSKKNTHITTTILTAWFHRQCQAHLMDGKMTSFKKITSPQHPTNINPNYRNSHPITKQTATKGTTKIIPGTQSYS